MRRYLLSLCLSFALPIMAQQSQITPPAKGSMPWFDTTAWNDSGSNQTTTSSILSGSNQAFLNSPIDFKNGQGIAIFGAGPTSTLAASTKGSGSQISTVANISKNVPGSPSFGVDGITCSGGEAVVTTFGWFGFPNNSTVTIAGTVSYNGVFAIKVKGNTTFTFPTSCQGTNQGGTVTLNAGPMTFNYRIVAEDANSGYSPASANIQITHGNLLSPEVKNRLTWTAVTNATQYLVYGDRGTRGSLVCLGPANATTEAGASPVWDDYGTQQACPANAPVNPPETAYPGIFIATILSGAGTTSLIVNARASNTVSLATTQHDETTAINNAISVAATLAVTGSGGGGNVHIPIGTHNFQTLVFPTTTPQSGGSMLIDFGGELSPRQPIEFNAVSNYTFRGDLGGGTFTAFGSTGASIIDPNGLNPVVRLSGLDSPETLSDFKIPFCPGICVSVEQGPTYIILHNLNLTTQIRAPGSPLNMTASTADFGVTVTGGVYNTQGNSIVPAIEDKNFGTLTMDGVDFSGSGVRVSCTNGTVVGVITLTGHFQQSIYENGNTPLLTLNNPPGCGFYDIEVDHAQVADGIAGQDFGLINIPNANSAVYNIRVMSSQSGTNQTIEGAGTNSINGFFAVCALTTGSCTATGAQGYGAYPAGMFVDSNGSWFLSSKGSGIVPFHTIMNGSSFAPAISVERPLGTVLGAINSDGSYRTSGAVFSRLPTCTGSTEGTTHAVTDSNTNTWGATITGGGPNHVLAYCDGTSWTVIAK